MASMDWTVTVEGCRWDALMAVVGVLYCAA